LYCHNPDTQDIRGGYSLPFKKIVEMAQEQEHYFHEKGGITVSGGEPLLQAKKLAAFFKSLNKRKIHTVLDTNGSILDGQVKELLKYTDLVLLDVKHIDPASHQKLTAVGNKNVLAFASYLKKIKKPMWLRYVLVPGLTDQSMFLHDFGRYFKTFANIERLEILPYHKMGVYKYKELERKYELAKTPLPDEKTKNNAKKILKLYFSEVHLR